MIVKFLMIGIGVTVIVGVIGWYVIRSQNTSKDLPQRILNTLKTSLPINHKQRLVEWNNFTDLPIVEECLLRTYQSCFPVALFASDNFGGGQFVFQKPSDGTIDTRTIRSMLLADTSYKSILLLLPLDRLNRSGLLVDTMIENSAANGINPLITSEILKIWLKKDLPILQDNPQIDALAFGNSFDEIINQNKQIPMNLANYNSVFSSPVSAPTSSLAKQANQALNLLLASTFSPMQKSIVMYFYINFTRSEYENFVGDIARIVPNVGKFSMRRVTSKQEFQTSQQNELGLVFCNVKNGLEVLDCRKISDGILCLSRQIDKICLASYSLGSEGIP